MKFIPITGQTTLHELVQDFGAENTRSILNANRLTWRPDVGKQFKRLCQATISGTDPIEYQRKATLLNSYVQDDDVFERAALSGSSDWKLLSQLGTFSDMLKVPESITISDYSGMLGSGNPVTRTVYNTVMAQLIDSESHNVDESAFNTYSTIQNVSLSRNDVSPSAFQWFELPWGEITLQSNMDNTSMDFPCYPETVSDSRRANYSTMPDLLYQYEPWQLYQGSGPREVTYKFDIHRDMWSGDHRDQKANELIRFCEAHCYPRFNGSLVNTGIVTLYIHGAPEIRGVITNVSTDWSGPIGSDGYYLFCELAITIVEVSGQPLNFDSVKSKPIIGN